jgi:hypothetical protein
MILKTKAVGKKELYLRLKRALELCNYRPKLEQNGLNLGKKVYAVIDGETSKVIQRNGYIVFVFSSGAVARNAAGCAIRIETHFEAIT